MRGPNAGLEAGSDDTWLVPITVTRTESSFVMVRLRADSFGEAFERAQAAVRTLCRNHELESAIHIDRADWLVEDYDEMGLDKSVSRVEDYEPDLDITNEPTRAEARLKKAQLALDLKA